MSLATVIKGKKYTKELTKKLIIISPDAINSEHFIDSINDLPNLRELVNNALVFTKYNTPMMSSDSGPNHDSMKTAKLSDQPGLKVIKNKKIKDYSGGTKMLVESFFFGNSIQKETCPNKTLLEYGFFGDNTLSIFEAWNKGINKKINLRDSFFPAYKIFKKKKKEEIVYKNVEKEKIRVFCETFNEVSYLKILKYLKNNSLPNYFFFWDYATDKAAHDFGFGEELVKNYKWIDKLIELIKDKASTLEDTLFIIASDHGMANVKKNLSLDEILKNIKNLSVDEILKDIKDAIGLFFGYGSARIYLKNKENIRDISNKLAEQEGIDFVLARENNYFLVFNKKGAAKIEHEDNKYKYTVIKNQDPLDFDKEVYKLISRFHTSEQCLEYTFNQKYRCAPVLLSYTLRINPNRKIQSGDIAIFAAEGYDFSKEKNKGLFRKIFTDTMYITQDGAYQKDNINTFLLISGYGDYIEKINKERIEAGKRKIYPVKDNYMYMVDFPVTLLDLIGWDYDIIEKFNFDGISIFQRDNNLYKII